MTVPPTYLLLPGRHGVATRSASAADQRRIGVVDGEGIGPEVVAASLAVLDAVISAFDLDLEIVRAPAIGSMGPHGFHVDEPARAFYDAAFAAGLPVLTGPAGGRFVYELRARYDLYVKLVPVRPTPAIADASILRPERLRDVDVLIVRDNIGGLYQGAFGRRDDGRTAYQEAAYAADQVDRLIAVAVRAAAARRGRLAVVTKPGGIPTISALWCERAEAAAAEGVVLEIIEVDNACYQLVADPHRFDVVAAPNMLGDVVADTAALVLGSRGMSYSANFGDGGRAVYQTGHGAARDLAGLDRANPVAQILTMAWLLRDSLALPDAADVIEDAVDATLAEGLRTPDIAAAGSRILGTAALAEAIAERVAQSAQERVAS